MTAVLIAVMILAALVSGCIGNDRSRTDVGGNNTSLYKENSEGHFWRDFWLYRMFFGNSGSSGSSGSYYHSPKAIGSIYTERSKGTKANIDVADPVIKTLKTKVRTITRRGGFGRRR